MWSASMRRLFSCCLIMLLIAAAPALAQAPNTEPEKTRIERLAALGRLWGAVNYFHPYLAYKEIDWDAALIATIPKVSAAKSTEEYRAAIDGLLATLGDPATTTAVEPAPVTVTPAPAEQPARVVNDMLVVTCQGMGELVSRSGTAIKSITDYLAANPKGIVFDCRTRGTGPDCLA